MRACKYSMPGYYCTFCIVNLLLCACTYKMYNCKGSLSQPFLPFCFSYFHLRNPRELRLMNPEDNNDTVTHRLNLFLRRWMREGVAHLRSGYSRLSRLSGSVTSVDSVGNIHTDLSIASDLNVSDGQIEPPELPHPMQACNPHNQEFVLPNLHVTQPLPQDSAEERSTQVDTQSLSAQNHDVMAVEDGEPHDGQYIVSNNLPLPPHPLPEEERHSGDGMA